MKLAYHPVPNKPGLWLLVEKDGVTLHQVFYYATVLHICVYNPEWSKQLIPRQPITYSISEYNKSGKHWILLKGLEGEPVAVQILEER